jgi:hypothetical protein
MASISLNPIDFYTIILKIHSRHQIYSDLLLKYAPFFASIGILKDKGDSYFTNSGEMKRGQIMDIPRIPGNELSIHITYSFDEKLSTTQSMRTNFYLSQVVGDDYVDVDGIIMPLLYMKLGLWWSKIMKR